MIRQPLGVVAAVASSLRNRAVRPGTAVFGEVGLGGEVRATPQAALRVKEASQLGFTRCVMPAGNSASAAAGESCRHVGVGTVAEALEALIE